MNWRDIANPAAGGAEVFTHQVARHWANWGHEVTVLTSRFENAPPEDSLDGVRVIRVGNRFTVYNRAKQAYLKRFRGQMDVVIDEINTRPFFTPRYVEQSTALVALIHQLAREFWFYETPFPVNIIGRYLLEDHWLRSYREIPTITVSQSTLNDLLALGFHNVSVVPEGISVKVDSQLEKESIPTLIYVGRLKRAKLPHHAIQAFRVAKKKVPDVRLWIVGDGYMRERLKREAPEGTTFFGRVSEAKKEELLTRAHVLLYPAVREGWGLTVSEAGALGTPAVGYDVPGLRDSIRDGETGMLVPSRNATKLGEVAASLLINRELRERLAREAALWAGSLSWDRSARIMIDRLRQVQEQVQSH